MNEFVAFVLGILGGIAAGIGGAVGADWLKRWIYRPKLEILEDKPEIGEVFSCHAVCVKNNGRSVAKRCHAIVTFPDLVEDDLLPEKQIWKVKDLGLDKRKFALDKDATYLMKPGKGFTKIVNEYLSWSPVGNPLAVDIFPNTSQKVDICRFIKIEDGIKPRQIQIPSENGWRSMRAAVINRRYAMTLRIAAEDGTCMEVNFTIKALGDDITLEKETQRDNV